MPPETQEQRNIRHNAMVDRLLPLGWNCAPYSASRGQFRAFIFEKDGILYDLGAADLDQLDYIVANNLFIVEWDRG
jgi:hypothetical protein